MLPPSHVVPFCWLGPDGVAAAGLSLPLIVGEIRELKREGKASGVTGWC